MNKIEEILKKFPNRDREDLIPILQDVQRELGFISEEAVVQAGQYLRIPTSKIYAVSTFYDQFRFTATAKNTICLCNGTACHMKGSGSLLKEFEKQLGVSEGQFSKNKTFLIKTKPCMGACGKAPVITVNGDFYADVTEEKVADMIGSKVETA